MIKYVTGNLLEADVEALVNTVNTVGVMGKGVALQFRQAFPENYEEYRKACERGEVRPGEMFVVVIDRFSNPRYIINFPTKRHWKGKARIEDIESGLHALVEEVRKRSIHSLAIPPLGCGNGGLNWDEVRPRIVAVLADIPDTRVLLYAPTGAPSAEEMRVATRHPQMTPGRAALLGAMDNYALPGYRLTMLEVQKVAYLLQAAGEPLRLSFTRGKYGPYAEALHHVLQHIEGHYVRGYGDRGHGASIRLMPGAAEEACGFLRDHPKTLDRLEQVSRLIEGFETPYGMELLATVHWLALENAVAREDVRAAVDGVQSWNERKRVLFSSRHIETAWARLRDQRWI